MSEAKHYVGLSLCTVSEPNSNLLYRQTDALDGASRRSFTQKGKGQKPQNFLNTSPWCFRFKVQFIGKFFKEYYRDIQVMKVCVIFLKHLIR